MALNLALIPWLGIVGGALALALGRFIRLAQYVRLVGWQRLVGPQGPALLRVAVATALMGLGVYLFGALPLGEVIAIGALIYVILLFGLCAVSLHEVRWLGRALRPPRPPDDPGARRTRLIAHTAPLGSRGCSESCPC